MPTTQPAAMVDGERNALRRLLPAHDAGQYGIAVRPRWPYTEVLITAETLAALRKARAAITARRPDLDLAVIRGYETPQQTRTRNLLRHLGAGIFSLLYPCRFNEIPGIFSPNGHDRSGNHVDVQFSLNDKWVTLLKCGPLTSLRAIRKTMEQYRAELEIVHGTLINCGFRIHPNISEALQIHCDLASSL